jgi:hypothetical protein
LKKINNHQAPLSLFIFSALFLQACGPDVQAGIATGIAQTQQISALETAAVGGGGGDSGQAQSNAEPGQSNTAPLVSVSKNTNCRSGPRADYTLLTTINVGQQVEVLKTYSQEYLLIKNPNGSGDCWLFLRYADTTDFSAFNLVGATQPPTPKAPVKITAEVHLDEANFIQPGDQCPVQLVWVGLITVSGPAKIFYVWERSDGSHSSKESLTFTEFGSKKVSDVF